MTPYGGTDGGGTLFKLTPNNKLTTLYTFCSRPACLDGEYPGLIQKTNGKFYGTTSLGGTEYGNGLCPEACGTSFSLSVGLGRFVKTLPTFGKVGARIGILGTDLTNATSVMFNGTPTTFTIASPSLITAAVPTGATTGPVEVVTPGGTLTSNVSFRVLP